MRDGEATLGACLASLSVQTLADHEVVAVDDGSADGSGRLLRAHAARDARLRVLAAPPRGLVAALNHGLAACRAPLVARMDADDVADPRRLEAQARRFRDADAPDVLAARVRVVGDEAGPGMAEYVGWSNGLLTHEEMVADLFVESPLVHPSVMARAAALRALGGYRVFDGPEDYDLWLRAHAAGLRFAKLSEVLLDWRDSPRRLTRRDPRYGPDRFRALKIEALERAALRAGRAVVLWGGGPIGKAWSRALRARGHRVCAFVDVHPRRLGTSVHGAPVVPWPEAAAHAGALHLAAVGQRGGRARVRGLAASLGLRDGVDLIAVA